MLFEPAISIRSYPFIRLLIPLAIGIYIQWHVQFSLTLILASAGIVGLSIFLSLQLNFKIKYSLRLMIGSFYIIFFLILGLLLSYLQDIRNDKDWFGKNYTDEILFVQLYEPLSAKGKTYKATCKVFAKLDSNGIQHNARGKIFLYLKKDELPPTLKFGNTLLLKKPVDIIRNNGNPAALNYNRYCLFQGITHQAFLSGNDIIEIQSNAKSLYLRRLMFAARDSAIAILRRNIFSAKELGIAEALLIGYRNDLDRDLVQSYSNTGVVHIIAISGLHLGMIYVLLLKLLYPFRNRKGYLLLKSITILLVLWAFTFVAGAAPSVLRAAVMFSVFQLAEWLDHKPNGIATLTASAFILLLINPFYLWDVGFQLSYAAVLSIMIFYKPIYRSLFFRNGIVKIVWQLNAVSLSAQILTIPIAALHFHQFSNLFWVANFIAVPLSGFILYAEIGLLVCAWHKPFALFLGNIITKSTAWMNDFIEWIDTVSFSVSDGLFINTLQSILLLLFIACFAGWIFRKQAQLLSISLFLLLIFLSIDTKRAITNKEQQKMIVYNVPNKVAIEFISGHNNYFLGDTDLLNDNFLKNFHLKPARIKYHTYQHPGSITQLTGNPVIQFANKKIWIITDNTSFNATAIHPVFDYIIVAKNARINWDAFHASVECNTVIFDGSNSRWKVPAWQKDCHQLHLRTHNVLEQGAFMVNL